MAAAPTSNRVYACQEDWEMCDKWNKVLQGMCLMLLVNESECSEILAHFLILLREGRGGSKRFIRLNVGGVDTL
mgnify:CR=1 FL=1